MRKAPSKPMLKGKKSNLMPKLPADLAMAKPAKGMKHGKKASKKGC